MNHYNLFRALSKDLIRNSRTKNRQLIASSSLSLSNPENPRVELRMVPLNVKVCKYFITKYKKLNVALILYVQALHLSLVDARIMIFYSVTEIKFERF